MSQGYQSTQKSKDKEIIQVEQKKQQLESQIKEEQSLNIEDIEPANQIFIETNLPLAQNLKLQGNQLFKNQQYQTAIKKYQQSLRYSPKQNTKFRSIVYSNISICYSKMERITDSIVYCKKAIENDGTYMKAHLNLAKNYEKNDKLQQALEQYKKINQMNPMDMNNIAKIKELETKVHQRNEKMKEEALSGLKNIGNSLLGFFGMSLDNFKMEQGENGGYSVSFKK